MISFKCGCGEPLAAATEHAGLQVECPKCGIRLTVPAAASDFEYADDPAPPPPPKKKPVLVEDEPPSKKSAAPPPKKKPVLVDEDPPEKKKAKLVDEKPKRKKKKQRNYGDDDQPEHVKALMAKANADLDEQEERHAREGGGIHFTPGILAGGISVLIGLFLLVGMLCVGFIHFYGLALCGVLIIGGGIRCVLSFLGQGTD